MIYIFVILIVFARFQSVLSCSNQTFMLGVSGGKNDGNLYKHILPILLANFSSKATSKEFYSSTIEKSPNNDNVYGLYMCRGDIDLKSCHACVMLAKDDILAKRYGRGQETSLWYQHCMLRYSNKPFFGKLDNITVSMSWTNDKNATENPTRYANILRNTMNFLAVQAANGRKRFATTIVKFSEEESLYALAQCTMDLTMNDCRKCLMYLIGDSLPRIGASKTGDAINLNCMLRYDMFPFFYSDKVKPFRFSVVNSTGNTLRALRGRNNNNPFII